VLEKIGDYELVQHIATGGMAEIYLARLSSLGGFSRTLVVKRMLPQLAIREEFVKMFLDEARLAAQFQHPNIVQVNNLGESGGYYFMAMELVDGPHLGALFARSLRRRKPLTISICAYICARAADGLHYAHDLCDMNSGKPLHIVHRDISPQNILISRYGDVKVTDFGVAKADTQTTMTRTGVVKGKVSYMSPEQCLGEKVDRRTDVFALGIVLYELLTRRRLFREKSDLLVMQKITAQPIPAPSTENPAIDSKLDEICLKALARQQSDRYKSGQELAAALDDWLHQQQEANSRQDLGAWIDENAADLGFEIETKSAANVLNQKPQESAESELELAEDKTVATPALGSRPEHAVFAKEAGSAARLETDAPSEGTARVDTDSAVEPTKAVPAPIETNSAIHGASTVKDGTVIENVGGDFKSDISEIDEDIFSDGEKSLAEPEAADIEIDPNLLYDAAPVGASDLEISPFDSGPRIRRGLGLGVAAVASVFLCAAVAFLMMGDSNDLAKGSQPATEKFQADKDAQEEKPAAVNTNGDNADSKVEGARFSLTTSPAGAQVILNPEGGASKILQAPLLEHPVESDRNYQVSVKKDGFQTQKIVIKLDEDEHLMQEITLVAAIDTAKGRASPGANEDPAGKAEPSEAQADSSPEPKTKLADSSAPAASAKSTSQNESPSPAGTRGLEKPQDASTKTKATADASEKPAPIKQTTNRPKKNKRTASARTKTKTPAASSPARKKKSAGYGKLTVYSNPWVEVWTHGRKRGTSPFTQTTVPAGRTDILLVNKKLGIRSKWSIQVPRGGVYTLRLVFEKKGSTYKLKSKKKTVSH
jgi:serine/threonine protein kinase